jgi:phosphoenolpyruvate-protein phosphotransferase (PTS system enzyme I)
MRTLAGIQASPGIFIGTAYLFLEEEDFSIPNYSILDKDLSLEMGRFNRARAQAETELTELRNKANAEMGSEHAAIFDSHILMLNDVELLGQVESNMKRSLKNVEWILFQLEQSMVKRMGESDDSYLAERAADIKDVSRRVIGHLLKRERKSLSAIEGNVVLVARTLLPSEAIAMNREAIKAIALDAGGKTSHTAILARAFRIPAVLGLQEITKCVNSGDSIIVDGDSGAVIIDPDEKTLSHYKSLLKRAVNHEKELGSYCSLPSVTLDGRAVPLKANIEIPLEVEDALARGSDGVGLYRSEFLYLQPDSVPTEEDQYQAYAKVLASMGELPVTIRTLDLGGDKMVPELEIEGEKNPLLGWRAVRFCLDRQELFKNQLRALLRASTSGKLKIMFPMISGVEELERCLAVLEAAKAELRAKSVGFDEAVSVGIMIEIPSAAMTADVLAKKADFFSIGTNDLIQYSIAVDRGNERIAYLYQPFHPAVLRLIKTTIDHAHAAGKTVSMCGEMAGDPYACVVLLGLGLDEFSMSAASIPEIKRILRSVTVLDAKRLADSVMAMGSYVEIETAVRSWMDERYKLNKR